MKHKWECNGFGDGHGRRFECENCGKIHHNNDTDPDYNEECPVYPKIAKLISKISTLENKLYPLHHQFYFDIKRDVKGSCCSPHRVMDSMDSMNNDTVSIYNTEMTLSELCEFYAHLKNIIEPEGENK